MDAPSSLSPAPATPLPSELRSAIERERESGDDRFAHASVDNDSAMVIHCTLCMGSATVRTNDDAPGINFGSWFRHLKTASHNKNMTKKRPNDALYAGSGLSDDVSPDAVKSMRFSESECSSSESIKRGLKKLFSMEQQKEIAMQMYKNQGIKCELLEDVTTCLCHYCPNWKGIQLTVSSTTSVVYHFGRHVESFEHKKLRNSGAKMYDFFIREKSPFGDFPKLAEFTESSQQSFKLCRGFILNDDSPCVELHKEAFRTFSTRVFESDAAKYLWYKNKEKAPIQFEQSFVSNECTLFSVENSFCCAKCANIPNTPEWKAACDMVPYEEVKNTNNKYLLRHQLEEKVKLLQAQREKIKLYVLSLQRNVSNLRSKIDNDPFTKMKRDIKNSDFVGMIQTLIQLREENKLVDADARLNFMQDMVNCIEETVPKHRRISGVTKELFVALKQVGGLGAFEMMSNMIPRSISSLKRDERKLILKVQEGLSEVNMQVAIDSITSLAKQNGNDMNDLLFLMAKDETPIDARTYVIRDKEGLRLGGYCGYQYGKTPGNEHDCIGKKCKQATCAGHLCYQQSGDKHYFKTAEELVDLDAKLARGTQASAILIVPIHERLPAVPCHVLLTCGCVNIYEEAKILQKIRDMFSTVMEKKGFGRRLFIGEGSDGARIRVVNMMKDVNTTDTAKHIEGYQRFPLAAHCEGAELPLSIQLLGRVREDDGMCCHNHIQDQSHCVKKLVNSAIKRPALWFGGSITIDSIKGVKNEKDVSAFSTTAPTDKVIEHRDKMNFKEALALISVKTQEFLGASSTALLLFLNMIWMFNMMFHSINIPLLTRVQYCGYVITYMMCWYICIVEDPKKKLKSHFVTMEAFRDVIIASCGWFNTLIAIKKFTKLQKYACHRLGSDACERFFALLLGFGNIVAGKRDGNYGECLRSASSVNYLFSRHGAVEDGKFNTFRARPHHSVPVERKIGLPCEVARGFTTMQTPEVERLQDLKYEDIMNSCAAGEDEAIKDIKEKLGLTSLDGKGKADIFSYFKCLNFKSSNAADVNNDDVDGEDGGGEPVVGEEEEDESDEVIEHNRHQDPSADRQRQIDESNNDEDINRSIAENAATFEALEGLLPRGDIVKPADYLIPQKSEDGTTVVMVDSRTVCRLTNEAYFRGIREKNRLQKIMNAARKAKESLEGKKTESIGDNIGINFDVAIELYNEDDRQTTWEIGYITGMKKGTQRTIDTVNLALAKKAKHEGNSSYSVTVVLYRRLEDSEERKFMKPAPKVCPLNPLETSASKIIMTPLLSRDESGLYLEVSAPHYDYLTAHINHINARKAAGMGAAMADDDSLKFKVGTRVKAKASTNGKGKTFYGFVSAVVMNQRNKTLVKEYEIVFDDGERLTQKPLYVWHDEQVLFNIGDKVQGRYQGALNNTSWYHGTIVERSEVERHGGKVWVYSVDYDDGDKETDVYSEYIRRDDKDP